MSMIVHVVMLLVLTSVFVQFTSCREVVVPSQLVQLRCGCHSDIVDAVQPSSVFVQLMCGYHSDIVDGAAYVRMSFGNRGWFSSVQLGAEVLRVC